MTKEEIMDFLNEVCMPFINDERFSEDSVIGFWEQELDKRLNKDTKYRRLYE